MVWVGWRLKPDGEVRVVRRMSWRVVGAMDVLGWKRLVDRRVAERVRKAVAAAAAAVAVALLEDICCVCNYIYTLAGMI